MSETSRFPEVLDAAITARGLSLDRIRERLRVVGTPVSTATLSYWRTGRSLPRRRTSLRAVLELEGILGLPEGTLAALIPDPTGGGRQRNRPGFDATMPAAELTRALFDRLGVPAQRVLSLQSIQITLTRAAGGGPGVERVRELIRAEEDGAVAFGIAYVHQADGLSAPDIVAVTGCRVAQQVQVRSQHLTVARLELTRPLPRGAHQLVEYLVVPGPGAVPFMHVERTAVAGARYAVLEVRFHPDDVPSRVERYTRTSWGGEPHQVSPVEIQEGIAQTVFVEPVDPVCGLRWA